MTRQILPNRRGSELFDLEHSTFTKTHELDEMFAPEGEVWHVVGSDLVRGGAEGQSFVHNVWENGDELWNKLKFAVVARRGVGHAGGGQPPH